MLQKKKKVSFQEQYRCDSDPSHGVSNAALRIISQSQSPSRQQSAKNSPSLSILDKIVSQGHSIESDKSNPSISSPATQIIGPSSMRLSVQFQQAVESDPRRVVYPCDRMNRANRQHMVMKKVREMNEIKAQTHRIQRNRKLVTAPATVIMTKNQGELPSAFPVVESQLVSPITSQQELSSEERFDTMNQGVNDPLQRLLSIDSSKHEPTLQNMLISISMNGKESQQLLEDNISNKNSQMMQEETDRMLEEMDSVQLGQDNNTVSEEPPFIRSECSSPVQIPLPIKMMILKKKKGMQKVLD